MDTMYGLRVWQVAALAVQSLGAKGLAKQPDARCCMMKSARLHDAVETQDWWPPSCATLPVMISCSVDQRGLCLCWVMHTNHV